MPATPKNSRLTPSPNLNASPAAVVARMVLEAALRGAYKPKSQRRVIAELHAVVAFMEGRGSLPRINARQPVQEAQARIDAAEALRVALASREAL